MPNTLAHVGVQGVLSRLAFRKADPKWIYLGCVIPDVPWILQRMAKIAVPSVDPYTLRAYTIVQATLFSSLILCAAVALFSRRFWVTCALLSLNVLLHLLLDASQIKWANGVHFWAPFSWTLTNWGFFWPESWINYGLTGLGLFYIIRYFRRSLRRGELLWPGASRWVGSIALMFAYFALPVMWLQGPVEADNHFMQTYRTVPGNSLGHYVEFDRARYLAAPEGDSLEAWSSVRMHVEGIPLSASATVSARGFFTGEDDVKIVAHHVHADWFRDNATYLGLALILGVWVIAWVKRAPLRTVDSGNHRT